jgi:superfamily II DNA or RNA helicase
VVQSSPPLHDLVVTWLGPGFGAWSRNPSASYGDVMTLCERTLGSTVRPFVSDRAVGHDLPAEAAAAIGQTQITAVEVDADGLANVLLHRSPTEAWSASLVWLHHAVRLAGEIVTSRRMLPALRTSGLRWEAGWNVLTDDAVGEALQQLADAAPPAVWALDDRPALTQTSELVTVLVDGLCRSTLAEIDWRPPLPRARSSAVVALRRVTTALSGRDRVFLGDTPAHETAFAEWSTALSEVESVIEGAPEVTFRGRLLPPATDQPFESWTLEFDVVGADGDGIGFGEVWAGTDAALAFADGASLIPLRIRMTQLIDRLVAQLGMFVPLADELEPSRLELPVADVSDLLTDSLALCRRAGLPIVTPTDMMQRSARLTAKASAPSFASSGKGIGSAMVEVDWGVALGDLSLTPEELEALANSAADVVALRGEWVQIDRREINRVLRRLDHQQEHASELSPAELLRQSVEALDHGGDDDDLSADGWVAELLAGLPDDELQEAREPSGFVGELRPYQRRALSWLQFLGRLGLGGCLADDMGLGKTPTALAHLLQRTLDRLHGNLSPLPHLVICPLSVVANWEAEASRFAPELSVFIAHGPDRPRGADLVEQASKHDVVITTYGTASRVADEFAAIDWDVVVCDEAQAIKNHQTNAARTVRSFRSLQRVGLTGTPVENRLTELWAILDAINPGMLGGITWFRETFAVPIETANDENATLALRRLTAPFVLRRSKADRSLVPDLPDKVEQVEWSSLTPEQAGLYQAIVDDFLKTVAVSTGMERRGLVLATLTRLKQLCNHPAHYLGEDTVGDDRRSGKLERFDELIDTILDAEEQVIVFTQYREMGKLLSAHINARHRVDAPFLHGGTTRAQRDRMVAEFQAGDGPPVQLISLRAGGTGLNLTAASRVIHYDRWWNPAVEDQATDRSWRIGQTQTVFVHKLVCRGTLEERIDALLTEKRRLAESVVGSDESWLTELSTDELRDLLQLDLSATSGQDPEGSIW